MCAMFDWNKTFYNDSRSDALLSDIPAIISMRRRINDSKEMFLKTGNAKMSGDRLQTPIKTNNFDRPAARRDLFHEAISMCLPAKQRLSTDALNASLQIVEGNLFTLTELCAKWRKDFSNLKRQQKQMTAVAALITRRVLSFREVHERPLLRITKQNRKFARESRNSLKETWFLLIVSGGIFCLIGRWFKAESERRNARQHTPACGKLRRSALT